MRYFVMNGETERAIEMLKRSLEGTPVVDSLGEEPRYLKLPNSAVCNKVLHSAASRGVKNPTILDEVRNLVSELSSQSVRIYPRTLIALCDGYTQIGKATLARDVLLKHIQESPPEIGQDICSGLLEQQAIHKSRKGLVDAIKLMQGSNYSPSLRDCLDAILRMYVHGDELRYAKTFLSWMWFNHSYHSTTNTDTRILVWMQEKPSDTLLGGQLLATQSLILMRDMKDLEDIPTNISATAIGLCAIDRNYGAAMECLSRIGGSETDGGRFLVLSLLHCYTRTQKAQELIHLVNAALEKQILPAHILVQPILLDADCHPEFCKHVLQDLHKQGIPSLVCAMET